MTKNNVKVYIIIAIALAVFETVILCLIPFFSRTSAPNKISTEAYILSALFWTSILAEIFFVISASKIRKRIKHQTHEKDADMHLLPGIISFFKNPEAIICDVILFISIIGIIIIIALNVKTKWIIMSGVLTLFISFNLHCILNGKNYRYLKLLKDNKIEKEKKRK